MKRYVVGAAAVILLSGCGGSGDPEPVSASTQTEPRSVCSARLVGQDVEVTVRLQVGDRALDVAANQALVVLDLGTTNQTRQLTRDDRTGAGYTVVFDRLPSDSAVRSVSLVASRSPDDPGSIRCDDSAVTGSAALAPRSAPALLPESGR